MVNIQVFPNLNYDDWFGILVLTAFVGLFLVWGKLKNYLRERIEINIIRSLGLAIPYGYIEQALQFHGHFYRPALLLLQIIPFVNRNRWLWLGDVMLNIFVEDLFYWIFLWQIPTQWAWFYPVVGSFPVLYAVTFPIIVYAYWKSRRETNE